MTDPNRCHHPLITQLRWAQCRQIRHSLTYVWIMSFRQVIEFCNWHQILKYLFTFLFLFCWITQKIIWYSTQISTFKMSKWHDPYINQILSAVVDERWSLFWDIWLPNSKAEVWLRPNASVFIRILLLLNAFGLSSKNLVILYLNSAGFGRTCNRKTRN